MRDGKYIIDSIENGLVKLLYSEDETIEEMVNINLFNHPLKQGDVINIKIVDENLISEILEDETNLRREKARLMLEKLKKK